jgi:hypothetical protein
LSTDDVRAGTELASLFAAGRPIGSGRVVGTDLPLVSREVAAFVTSRRAALDIYHDGLGTGSLGELFDTGTRIGDSLLLRAICDATELP